VASLGFEHVYEAGSDPAAPTLLLLHGTGGTEHDLLPIAGMVSPASGVLSPRGKVLEGAMPRFFRRLAEGVFDLDDLRFRTRELATFVRDASAHYHFDATNIVAAGFSNGANIAASLLLLDGGPAPRSRLLSGAILFRAMVPIVPESLPDLSGVRILMSNGRLDSLIPAGQAQQLGDMFEDCGAQVRLEWQPGGHSLTKQDVVLAREWMTSG
jgi:phospholipase/carboxylesterase